MAFKPRGPNQTRCSWAEKKRRGLWKPLKESRPHDPLHEAKAFLKKAAGTAGLRDTESAAKALLGLPEAQKTEALGEINALLERCGSNDARDLITLQAASFILMALRRAGWAMLEPWERTQPLLEKHSGLLADSLFMGNANGTEPAALEALGLLAGCGAHPYDAAALRYILQRFMKRPEAASGYYNLTGILALEGPEGLRMVAEAMEGRRIEHCVGKLDYGDDRQFEGSAELMLLVASGRSYLAPHLSKVRDEMLSLMDDPGVYVEGADEDEELFEEKNRQEAVVRSKAAAVLGQLGSMGVPLVLEADGDDAASLESAGKVFSLLAAHGVALHLLIHEGDPESVRQVLAGVPDSHLHLASEDDARGAEAASLMQAALSPPGGCEEEALASRGEAVSRLREMQAEGLALEIGLDCPAGQEPEGQAAHLAGIMAMLEQDGLEVAIHLTGENAEEVARMAGQMHR